MLLVRIFNYNSNCLEKLPIDKFTVEKEGSQ